MSSAHPKPSGCLSKGFWCVELIKFLVLEYEREHSPFLAQLVKHSGELLDNGALGTDSLLILPLSSSLGAMEITREVLKSHIAIPALPSDDGDAPSKLRGLRQFTTLAGASVRISDDNVLIITAPLLVSERQLLVLRRDRLPLPLGPGGRVESIETILVSNPILFSVPLDAPPASSAGTASGGASAAAGARRGGPSRLPLFSSAPATSSVTELAVAAVAAGTSAHHWVVEPDSSWAINQAYRAIAEIAGLSAEQVSDLRAQVRAFADTLLAGPRSAEIMKASYRAFAESTLTSLARGAPERLPGYVVLSDNLERALFRLPRVYERAFLLDERLDLALSRRIVELRFIRAEHLDIKMPQSRAAHQKWEQAKMQLRDELNRRKAPADKLDAISAASSLLTQLASCDDKPKPVAADDFLPLLIFTVLRCNPPNLRSNLAFIETFSSAARMQSESEYQFCSLTSAVTFIETATAENFTIDKDDFERQLQHSRHVFGAPGAPRTLPSEDSDEDSASEASASDEHITEDGSESPVATSDLSGGSGGGGASDGAERGSGDRGRGKGGGSEAAADTERPPVEAAAAGAQEKAGPGITAASSSKPPSPTRPSSTASPPAACGDASLNADANADATATAPRPQSTSPLSAVLEGGPPTQPPPPPPGHLVSPRGSAGSTLVRDSSHGAFTTLSTLPLETVTLDQGADPLAAPPAPAPRPRRTRSERAHHTISPPARPTPAAHIEQGTSSAPTTSSAAPPSPRTSATSADSETSPPAVPPTSPATTSSPPPTPGIPESLSPRRASGQAPLPLQPSTATDSLRLLPKAPVAPPTPPPNFRLNKPPQLPPPRFVKPRVANSTTSTPFAAASAGVATPSPPAAVPSSGLVPASGPPPPPPLPATSHADAGVGAGYSPRARSSSPIAVPLSSSPSSKATPSASGSLGEQVDALAPRSPPPLPSLLVATTAASDRSAGSLFPPPSAGTAAGEGKEEPSDQLYASKAGTAREAPRASRSESQLGRNTQPQQGVAAHVSPPGPPPAACSPFAAAHGEAASPLPSALRKTASTSSASSSSSSSGAASSPLSSLRKTTSASSTSASSSAAASTAASAGLSSPPASPPSSPTRRPPSSAPAAVPSSSPRRRAPTPPPPASPTPPPPSPLPPLSSPSVATAPLPRQYAAEGAHTPLGLVGAGRALVSAAAVARARRNPAVVLAAVPVALLDDARALLHFSVLAAFESPCLLCVQALLTTARADPSCPTAADLPQRTRAFLEAFLEACVPE